MDQNWWPSWRKVKDMILMTGPLKGQYLQIFGLLPALLYAGIYWWYDVVLEQYAK